VDVDDVRSGHAFRRTLRHPEQRHDLRLAVPVPEGFEEELGALAAVRDRLGKESDPRARLPGEVQEQFLEPRVRA
jgi:hypothetical protein